MRVLGLIFVLFVGVQANSSLALDGFNCEQRRAADRVNYDEVDRCKIIVRCDPQLFGFKNTKVYQLVVYDVQTDLEDLLLETPDFMVANEEARKLTRSCFCVGVDIDLQHNNKLCH